ncbi:MAG: hypothetical protein HY543_08015 [Deltaproteobacteria bacterium]|nr:hypothetical protein [Deltaproteobacteria bacterium]
MRRYAWILSLLLLGAPFRGWATMAMPLDAEQLVKRADVVVVGVVQSAQPGERKSALLNGPLAVTAYSILVRDVVKGNLKVGELFQFEQVGSAQATGPGYRPAGVPGYVVGQEYLLFLRKLSNGLFALVGLDQGRCRILQTEQGKAVECGFQNRFLFGGSDGARPPLTVKGATKAEQTAMQQTGGPVPYGDLLSILRKMAPPTDQK